jgi:RHS repeat-associated protein
MSYSGLDQTQRVQTGTTSFVYDLIGLARQSDPSGTVYELRCPCGQLLSERSSTGTNYFLFDALGSTLGLADSAGALVASWRYDPWGNVLSKTGSATTPVLFQGAYLDASTALYKMGARYYEPSIGRWTQPDPLRGDLASPTTLNRYAFVENIPTGLTDPSGYYCAFYAQIAQVYRDYSAFYRFLGGYYLFLASRLPPWLSQGYIAWALASFWLSAYFGAWSWYFSRLAILFRC